LDKVLAYMHKLENLLSDSHKAPPNSLN